MKKILILMIFSVSSYALTQECSVAYSNYLNAAQIYKEMKGQIDRSGYYTNQQAFLLGTYYNTKNYNAKILDKCGIKLPEIGTNSHNLKLKSIKRVNLEPHQKGSQQVNYAGLVNSYCESTRQLETIRERNNATGMISEIDLQAFNGWDTQQYAAIQNLARLGIDYHSIDSDDCHKAQQIEAKNQK